MATNKHLTLDDRIKIFQMLEDNQSFKAIAAELGKSPSTISREIRSHIVFEKKGGYGRAYNSCVRRLSCDVRLLCGECVSRRKNAFCRFCGQCNKNCPDYRQESCGSHQKPPYVCNGCPDKASTLEKRRYRSVTADTEYRAVLSESREGITLCEDELRQLDGLVSPLLKKGQSFHHICASNPDSIMLSQSTLYRLMDYGLFTAANIDLPLKVRYRARKKKKAHKVDKACRVGRTYADFLAFREENPDVPVVGMDTVEGNKGGTVLLTVHFVESEFMLAFLRGRNDSRSVIDAIDGLCLVLGPDVFAGLFPLILTDNGSEFSNPQALEFDGRGNRRTRIFYCDPNSPHQKGSTEKNHVFIRRFVPKGKSFDGLTQEDIGRMMDHINSYSRGSLGGRCPHEVFAFMHGGVVPDLPGCRWIPANDVTLNASVFGGDENAVTPDERAETERWLADGNSVHENPWHYHYGDGRVMDFPDDPDAHPPF